MSRTPSFDRTDVVRRAMHVFWRRGYTQTTVSDLVAATGLQPGSLYAAFGNKKGVFLEVLEAYNRQFLDRVATLVRDRRPALGCLRELLETIAAEHASGANRQGCLAVNALLEMAEHEPDVAARLATHNENVRAALARLLERGQSEGDIDRTREANALSAFLVNNLWGMRVMCRARPDRASARAVVDGILGALAAR